MHVFQTKGSTKQTARWTKEEEDKLREGVEALGDREWERLSYVYLEGRKSPLQCWQRWEKMVKPGMSVPQSSQQLIG